MSETGTKPARPAQVTFAGWLIMVGSVFVVLMVWDRIAGLHTMDAQTSMQDVLDEPYATSLGLDLAGLRSLIRALSMVSAACATAMAVLAYQALERNRTAVIALSVLAVPFFLVGLVLTGLSAGDFLTSAIAAAVGTLWLGPARAWFSGRTPAPSARPTDVRRDAGRGPQPGPDAHRSDPLADPAPRVEPGPASTPFGDAPQAPPRRPYGQVMAPYGLGQAPPTGTSPLATGDRTRAVARTGDRPVALLLACLVTWLFCVLTAIVLVGSIGLLASDSSTLLDKMRDQNPDLGRQGVSDHLILTVCFITCGLLVLWAIAAGLVAVLVFRGVRWAWWALLVSTVAVAGICVVGVIGSLVMLLPLAGAGATISLLVRPEVRRWLA